uniref:Ig-like domain-containing protein n=1 Tax=Amphiprion percula TaxID=161767 RepID=A0A3P8U5E5_AMPPE
SIISSRAVHLLSSFHCFFIIGVFLLLCSQVIGPLHPIVALIGEDIILPCYLKPVMNIRPVSRTSLFTDELKAITNVTCDKVLCLGKTEDVQECIKPLFKTSCLPSSGAASSLVNISEISRNSSAVELQCKSAGWYPEPEVLWLNGEGNVLSAGPTETFRDPDDLYTVSSRVTVEKRHSNKFTCRVQQNNINQSRETWIHVPGRLRQSYFHILSLHNCVCILYELISVMHFRKLQSKNEKEETQTEAEEDEKDLQRKKEELQKQLKRLETALERSNKQVDVLRHKKMKATKEKEETIRKLETENRNENQSESDEDL